MPEPDGCQVKTSQRGPRRRCFIAPGTIRERAKEQWEDRMLTSTGHPRLRPAQSAMRICCDNRGQAVVEFTLCFILLLVIAWIPADFGLMFYTGQLAQNAAREGARVAAADPTLSTATQTCTVPCASDAEILQQIGKRLANGISSSTQTVTLEGQFSGTVPTCDRVVRVTITGTYYLFFYRMLNWFNANISPSTNYTRRTDMRYEHQC